MASKAVLLIGVIGAGVAALFAFGKHADAQGRTPKVFTIPPNATRAHLPAVDGGIALEAADYPAEPGQPAGRYMLIWDPAEPDTFVALFFPAATPTNPAIMSVGKTANSQLVLSTIPNLLARLKAGG